MRRDEETDYRTVRLGKKEMFFSVLGGLGLSAAAAFLFYRSPAAMILAVVFLPLYTAGRKREYIRARQERLMRQFRSGLQMVAGSLAAGYSMENAWFSAQEEIGRLYGTDSEFYQELWRMNRKVRMNEPFDKVLMDFARRSGVEDVFHFAEIYRYARKSGGNIAQIIQRTTKRMQEKEEVMAEIANAVAAKKMEQRMIMFLLPGILLFITLSSPGYAEALYGTFSGVIVMSVCLAGYIFSCGWAERLTDIRI